MTQPSSGRSRGRADDPLAARLLLDEDVRDVLGPFLDRACSAQEVATELGRDLDWVIYRIKRLHQAGVLEVVGERRRGGRSIKLYRSTFDTWFVPFEALPFADVEETLTAVHVAQARRLGRASARHLVHTPWAGFLIERREDGRTWVCGASDGVVSSESGRAWRGAAGSGQGAWVTDATVELRLSPDDARALNEELMALVERYLDVGGSDARPNRLLVVASVPLDDG
jgi:hypothetical protein